MTTNSSSITVITGAGSGIGAALSRRLAGPGVRLIISTGHNADGLDQVSEDCRKAGAEVTAHVGDLRNALTAGEIITLAAQRYGRLDHLVHVAGFADRSPVGQLEDERFAKSFELVELAFLRLTTAALPLLKQSEQGRIVATSTFLAHCYKLVDGEFPASAAAKAGLEALVRSLAAQLAPSGCTANCVVPGYIRKDPGAESALSEAEWQKVAERVPMKRLGRPDEIAAMIGFLLSRDAAYITGQCIHINGGLTL
jgi:NAD(P)-dependent dehydrogenase (short-subunit alcohol dehydrogenase family)